MSSEQMTELATGTTPWRHQGITYKKNELWIDVVENINLLVSPQGKNKPLVLVFTFI